MITQRITEYSAISDTNAEISVQGIARKISLQNKEADKQAIITEYLNKVKRELIDSISKFDSSPCNSSHSVNMEDAQNPLLFQDAQDPYEDTRELTEEEMDKEFETVKKFLQDLEKGQK